MGETRGSSEMVPGGSGSGSLCSAELSVQSPAFLAEHIPDGKAIQLHFPGKSYLDCFPLSRETKSSLEEDFLLNQADEVKLQIRCGRCQITAQSFAEIKFHLLHVHGEEIQGRLQEVILPGSRPGTAHQKQFSNRRKQVTPCASVEDFPAFPKVRGPPAPHQHREEALAESEGARWGRGSPQHSTRLLWSRSGFNCLLCAQMLGRKEDLLLHWVHQHNCEDPTRLWALLGTFSNQGVPELPGEARH